MLLSFGFANPPSSESFEDTFDEDEDEDEEEEADDVDDDDSFLLFGDALLNFFAFECECAHTTWDPLEGRSSELPTPPPTPLRPPTPRPERRRR